MGAATAAIAFVNIDSYDDQLDVVISKLQIADSESEVFQKKISALDAANEIRVYMNNFMPDGGEVSNLVFLGMVYNILNQDDW